MCGVPVVFAEYRCGHKLGSIMKYRWLMLLTFLCLGSVRAAQKYCTDSPGPNYVISQGPGELYYPYSIATNPGMTSYTNNMACLWTFNAPVTGTPSLTNYLIGLKFTYFMTENVNDPVLIFNGSSAVESLLVWNGSGVKTNSVPPVYSGAAMTLTFSSNPVYTMNGIARSLFL